MNNRHRKFLRRRVVASGILLVIALGAIWYSFWGYMVEHSAWVMDKKYKAGMESTLKMLAEEEKLSFSGTITKEKEKIKQQVSAEFDRRAAEALEQSKKDEQETEDISQSGIDLSELSILAVPNIGNLDGQYVISPAGNLIIRSVPFADAESAIDSSIAFSRRSPLLGILIGHSSSLSLGDPLYRKSFAFLDGIQIGDTIHIGGKDYRTVARSIISPRLSGVKAILSEPKVPTLRLVTCWPIGTADKRLVIDLVEVVKLKVF